MRNHSSDVTDPVSTGTGIRFDNTYARLPERFFARQPPTPVAAPRIVAVNTALAREFGFDPDWLTTPDGVAMLSGNRLPAGAEPIATAYAGHQFGGFVPQLGDGRAVLLGEFVGRDGLRRDLQLKGAGRTPFSRGGDGRAALGPVLREYIVSEAMATLGIPTTRALAAVTTGEPVLREQVLPGAILTRVAQSHIRVGTFQYFAARSDREALTALADHVIARHYPDAAAAPNPYVAMFEGVVARQAKLVAAWMHVGFIHGVMNTDNCSIAGETIDFGPCAFMDRYDPAAVFSSIDADGRYAYSNQPPIVQWNLARLAEAMLPLFDADQNRAVAQAQRSLDPFRAAFDAAYSAGWAAKIGIAAPRDDDRTLVLGLFSAMASGQADFTLTLRHLSGAEVAGSLDAEAFRAQFRDPTVVDPWLDAWRARIAAEGQPPDARRDAMRRTNPAFIPRNHRIEQAITAAVAGDDFEPFQRLVRVLARPFEDQPADADLMAPPLSHEIVQATFCGT